MKLPQTDELNKALSIAQNFTKKSANFVNGDGRNNQDSIHSNPLNNENGSVSRTAGATGDGNDPVNSSNLTHTNPVGQTGNGVHAEGTKTTKPDNVKGDPVDTSGDGHADDPENKSETQKSYDSSKTKNGANRPHTPLKNGTRDLGDKPNANAKAENHITDAASGTKHDVNDLKSMKEAIKALTNGIQITSGQINSLNRQVSTDLKNMKNAITKSAPTQDVSSKENKVVGANKNNADDKHMNPANIRGMFGHAEHAKGKGKHSKNYEMGEAEHAVTQCHNSHKSLTDDDMKDIEAKGLEAMTNAMNSMADDKVEANKSLATQLSSAVKAGNSEEVGKLNYKMNHANKAMQKMTPKACARMMARAANTHDSAMMKSCEEQMAHDMSSAKADKSVSTDSTAAKNVTNVDHNSKADLESLSANSKEKPNNASDDINHSTKSVSASGTTKSMPHGKAVGANRPQTKKSAKHNVNKSLINPVALKNRAQLLKSIYKQKGQHMIGSDHIVNKSINMAQQGVKELNPQLLQKSLNTFNAFVMRNNLSK